MAQGDSSTVYRNFNSSDTTSYSIGNYIWPTVDSLGWSKEGSYFVEWNSNRNGTGTSYQPGTTAYSGSTAYAIWAEFNDITVTKNTTSGSERWDVQYTADQAGIIDKTLYTAGTLLDRDEKVSITIPSGSAATPATTITPNDITISVNSSTGLITASNTQKTQSVTPTVSAGYISSGTAGTITVSAKSATSQLSTQAAATITPTTSNQTAVAAGKYTLGAVTVVGDANLVAANIAEDVTIFGVTGTHQGGVILPAANGEDF